MYAFIKRVLCEIRALLREMCAFISNVILLGSLCEICSLFRNPWAQPGPGPKRAWAPILYVFVLVLKYSWEAEEEDEEEWEEEDEV